MFSWSIDGEFECLFVSWLLVERLLGSGGGGGGLGGSGCLLGGGSMIIIR